MISFVFRPKQLNSKMNKLVLLLGLFLVAVAAMPLEEGKFLNFLIKPYKSLMKIYKVRCVELNVMTVTIENW